MKHTTKLLVLVAGLLGAVGLAGAGWAYWTASGSGTVAATVGTLNAPTGVGATSPASGLVDVSWTDVPANGDIVVTGYYVQRGTTNVCGAPGSPLDSTATICHDTNLPQGTHTYTVTAIFRSWTASSSTSPFTLSAGPPSKLAFLQQPTNTVSAQSIAPGVSVQVLDAANNLTTSTASVTVAIGSNPNTGSLSGTKTLAAVSGTATFSGLSIDKAGTGYTLTGASTGLTGTTSSTFNITAGPPSKLAFLQQPTNTVSAQSIAPGVSVQVLDAANNLTTSTASVTVAIGSNPNTGSLSGTKTLAAVSGTATFSGLSIDKAGTGYTLTGASTGLTGTTSSTFNISYQLVFATQPSNATAGQSITPAVVVKVEDGLGVVITSGSGSNASVTVAIGSNPSIGTLSGTKTITAASGVATFSGLSIDKAGAGYTVTAASTGMTSGTSVSFTINGGAPASLQLSQCAIGGTSVTCGAGPGPFLLGNGGSTRALTAIVDALDAFGNPATITSGLSISVTSGNTTNYTVTGSPLTIDGSATPANRSTTGFTVTKNGSANNSTTITVHAAGITPDLIFTVQKQ